MADNLLVDIIVPETNSMSVDILPVATGMVVENIQMATNVSVDIIQNDAISVDIISGSVKGDKGDPGGVAITKVAGESIGGQRVVILNNEGKVVYASSFIETHSNKILGITTHAATIDSEVAVQITDVMEELTWTWLPDLPIFLGNNGMLTQTVGETGLFILQIGVALSQTKIYIEKQLSLFK